MRETRGGRVEHCIESVPAAICTFVLLNGALVTAPRIELLEPRYPLSGGFEAHVDFQPASRPVPDGYVADTGALFGARANGMSYGWNAPRAAEVVARRPQRTAPGDDPRYDTFALLNWRGRGSQWQLALPNGSYQVSITAGDAAVAAGEQRILVNGRMVVDARATAAHRWVAGTQQVAVTDGLLTVTVPRGSSARIDSSTSRQRRRNLRRPRRRRLQSRHRLRRPPCHHRR